jgi:hypothetical protein
LRKNNGGKGRKEERKQENNLRKNNGGKGRREERKPENNLRKDNGGKGRKQERKPKRITGFRWIVMEGAVTRQFFLLARTVKIPLLQRGEPEIRIFKLLRILLGSSYHNQHHIVLILLIHSIDTWKYFIIN